MRTYEYKGEEGGGVLKNRSENAYILNGWPQTNAVEYFWCIGPAKYTRASPSARREKLL